MDLTINLELRSVLLGLAALGLFGWLYNAAIARLERTGEDRGYTAFLVVGGCLAAIVVYGLIVWSIELGLLLLFAFGACGTPMILGSVRRYNQQRRSDDLATQHEAQEALDDA